MLRAAARSLVIAATSVGSRNRITTLRPLSHSFTQSPVRSLCGGTDLGPQAVDCELNPGCCDLFLHSSSRSLTMGSTPSARTRRGFTLIELLSGYCHHRDFDRSFIARRAEGA